MLNIIFEDKYLLAVEKPVGIASQNDSGGDLVGMAAEYTGCDVHIINRLDQPVGGLVLFAKDKNTAALFADTDITKHYLTVVCGVPEQNGRLENYLMHNKRLNISKPVNKGMGKPAVLEYEKLWQKQDTALLKVHLITGRHHQIRAQMLANGTPVYGDRKYNPAFKHKRNCAPALFSHSMQFVHPVTGKTLSLKVYPKDEIFKEDS